VIVDYRRRRFQVWEYRVSHASLLIRSPKSSHFEQNVDIMFVGVEYLRVPSSLQGVVLDESTDEDLSEVKGVAENVDRGRVHVLISEGNRFIVVASACKVSENDGDIFESPF